MAVEYLLISGPTEELNAFEERLNNKKFRNFFKIGSLSPLPWLEKGAQMWFRVGEQFIPGTLPIPDGPPILFDSSIPVQGWNEHCRPEQEGYFETIGKAFDQTVQEILNWMVSTDPYNSETEKPVVRGKDDSKLGIRRELRRYAFTSQNNECTRDVRYRAADWLEANRKDFPNLVIDREIKTKALPGNPPSSDGAPVPEEAIPEPNMDANTYIHQSGFKNIGLVARAGAANNRGGAAFNIHERARGAGSIIIIVDTAPKHGENVVWDSVDTLIDLEPEKYTGFRAPASKVAVKYHGLMIANLCKLIAPDARIVLVRALDDNGEGNTDEIIRVLNYLVWSVPGRVTYGDITNNLPDSADSRKPWISREERLVINLSLEVLNSGEEKVDALSFLYAVEALNLKGAVVVAAAGNDSQPGINHNPGEPAAYGLFPGYTANDYRMMEDQEPVEDEPEDSPLMLEPYNMVIGVASSLKRAPYLYASYSNDGPLAAPSDEILLDPGCELELPEVKRDKKTGKFVYDENGAHQIEPGKTQRSRYVTWSGTSFAAPIVAGQAALLLGRRLDDSRSLFPAEVKSRIWSTARRPRFWNRPYIVNIPRSL